MLLLLSTTACASRGTPFAARFITEGTPSVNVGGIETPVYGQPLGPPRAVLPPAPGISAVPSRTSSNLSTLEATSPRLQQALSALAMDPTPARYFDVAAAYISAGVPDRAYDFLTEGLRQDKTDVALHDALARIWRDWGFPQRALSSANAAVYYGPDSPEARNTLGTVLWRLGQREQARVAFRSAVALDDNAGYAWRNLCTAELAGGRTAAAIAACRRAYPRGRGRKESYR